MDGDRRCVHDFGDVDDATAALLLELHISDIEELLSTSKGKGREGECTDADLALSIYQGELKERDAVITDSRMARSLTHAVLTDAATLTYFSEEHAIAQDRAFARGIAGAHVNLPATEPNTGDFGLDDSLLSRLRVFHVSGENKEFDHSGPTVQGNDSSTAESSAMAASRKNTMPSVHCQCTVCDTEKPNYEVCQTPCGHQYCQECLHTLFELSTTDETLYPPRCCRQEIPLASAKVYLDPVLVHTFEQKSIEFKSSDRIYCSQPTCSSFIPTTSIIDERATCAICGWRTCTICKGNTHDGDCPQDIATQQILEVAREAGWQRCYSCRRLIELDVGCNHMT